MAGSFCVGCGAPLTPGTRFCSYCGRPVPTGATAPAPLPASTPTGPMPGAGTAAPSPYAPPPRRRRSRLATVVVLVVVLLVVVAAVGYFFLLAKAPNVQVTAINVYAPDNVCGQSLSPGYFGFNATPGTDYAMELPLQNYNSTPCTIQSVTTNTSGFGVLDAQVPDPIAGGANGDLNLTLALPGGSYTGVVNLVFQ